MLYLALDEKSDKDGEKKLAYKQGYTQGTVGVDNHRGETQNSAEAIENGNSLLLAETHIDKTVVKMSAVGSHGTLTPEKAADDSEESVEKGQRHSQHGHNEGDDGVELEHGADGNGGKSKAKQQSAGVAHKNLCGVCVEGQEADAGAHKCGENDGNIALGEDERNHQHGDGAYAAYAAGKSVQTVDKVNGIGDGNYPDDGDGDAERAEEENGVLTENVGVEKDVYNNAVSNGNDCCGNLADELHPPLQGLDIVNSAGGHDDEAADESASKGLVNFSEEENGQQKADKYSHATHTGDGFFVDSAGVLGHINCTNLLGKALDGRCGGKSQYYGCNQCQNYFQPKLHFRKHKNLLLYV